MFPVFHRKAFVATGAFTLALVVGFLWQAGAWFPALPLILFYGVLVLNTYFSIECFSHIIAPADRLQQGVDLVLVILYFLLAWDIFQPLLFSEVALALFGVATLKYVLLLGKTQYDTFLRKKITIDAIGVLGCALVVLGMQGGSVELTAWIWAGAFALANVYVLLIRPMYVLPAEQV